MFCFLVLQNQLLSAKEDLFERAWTFQDSLKAGYKKDHPTSYGSLHSDYRRKLQVLLSKCYEEVLGCKGASGVATQRDLKFRWSIKPLPPAPSSGDGRDDGDVRPQQQPSPAGTAEGAAEEGARRGGDHPSQQSHF